MLKLWLQRGAWLLNGRPCLTYRCIPLLLNPITWYLTWSCSVLWCPWRLLIELRHLADLAVQRATLGVVDVFWWNALPGAVDWIEAGPTCIILVLVSLVSFLDPSKTALSIWSLCQSGFLGIFISIGAINRFRKALSDRSIRVLFHVNLRESPCRYSVSRFCTQILISVWDPPLSNPNLRTRWYRTSKTAELSGFLVLQIALRGSIWEVFWVKYLLIGWESLLLVISGCRLPNRFYWDILWSLKRLIGTCWSCWCNPNIPWNIVRVDRLHRYWSLPIAILQIGWGGAFI